MNTLTGNITSVETNGSLSLVKVTVGTNEVIAIVIDTPETAPFLTTENNVKVIFKETEVVLATSEYDGISMQNQLSGVIEAIEQGVLLSKVVVQTDTTSISSIITTKALKKLNLKVGSQATALIKTNEIMLSE